MCVCVCICLQYAHVPSGLPHPPLPSPGGTIPASVSTCRPGRLCLLSFLAPSLLAALVHLGTQTANIGVLQAVGVACTEAVSLLHCCQVTLTLLKNTDHTLQDPRCGINTSLSQNCCMNPVLVQQSIVSTLFFGSRSELLE